MSLLSNIASHVRRAATAPAPPPASSTRRRPRRRLVQAETTALVPVSQPVTEPANASTPDTFPALPRAWASDALRAADRVAEVDARQTETNLHVSSLIRACPRALQLAVLDGLSVVSVPTGQDKLMWAIGRTVEHHIRTVLIRSVGHGRIAGHWQCPCGGITIPSMAGGWTGDEDDPWCPHCPKSAEAYRYQEVALVNVANGISGSPDLLVLHGRRSNPSYEVIEIKSIAQSRFSVLTEANADHVLQVTGYMRMLSQAGHRVQGGRVIYGSKDYTFTGIPYREFIVPVSEAIAEGDSAPLPVHTWRRLERLARSVRAFRASPDERRLFGRLPTCDTGNGSPTSTAAKCSHCVSCFARPNSTLEP